MQAAIKTARQDIVKSLFLFCESFALLFSNSKEVSNDMETGIRVCTGISFGVLNFVQHENMRSCFHLQIYYEMTGLNEMKLCLFDIFSWNALCHYDECSSPGNHNSFFCLLK